MRKTMRRWRLHHRADLGLDDLVRWARSVIQGWVLYYGRFYPSAKSLPALEPCGKRWDDRSRMSREVHVRFWKSVGVRFPRATRLPLYRQEGIFGRAGLAIPQSTLAQWVGQIFSPWSMR